MDAKWFQAIDCEKLIITEFRSAADKTVVREVVIEDQSSIRSLQTKINQMPTKGDEMIKMGGSASYLVLTFICGERDERVQFYNSKIKTPNTSFYSRNSVPLETEVWSEIQSHFGMPVERK